MTTPSIPVTATPSIPVTDSSPTDEVHTPEQTPRKRGFRVSTKGNYFTHTHTHTHTDRKAINRGERSPLK